MIKIFHGENTVASRAALLSQIDSLKQRGFSVQKKSIEELSLNEAETLLGTSAMFAQEELVILEGVLGGVVSQLKKRIVELTLHSTVSIFFWEPKDLSATALKIFPKETEVLAFPVAKKIWNWLESVRGGNARQSIELLRAAAAQDSVEFCFIMLCAHIRKMILVKDGCPPKQAPFAAKKLQSQTAGFSWEKLLAMQAWCLKTDVAMKSGTSVLPLENELDLFLLSL